jgi:hypothetical protein
MMEMDGTPSPAAFSPLPVLAGGGEEHQQVGHLLVQAWLS